MVGFTPDIPDFGKWSRVSTFLKSFSHSAGADRKNYSKSSSTRDDLRHQKKRLRFYGLFVEYFPRDKSIYINSHRKEEGRRRLFSPFDLYDLGHVATSGVERDYQLKKTVGQLAKSGPYRRFTFEKETIERLCELNQALPSFADVTDRIIDAVCVVRKYSRPIRITPILLVGEPGIGKSHYSFELSRCLGTPIKPVAMDNLQEGSGLAGSSFIYANSQPGEVFKVLTDQDHLSLLRLFRVYQLAAVPPPERLLYDLLHPDSRFER